jgi:hypothetical protein
MKMMQSLVRISAACLALGSLGAVAHADNFLDLRHVRHVSTLRATFSFTAPTGFTVTQPADGPADPSIFDASSASPVATMHATIANGARVTDDAVIDAELQKIVASFPSDHPGMTAKVMKREILTVANAPVAHLVIEGVPAKKKPKKSALPREVHYYFGNGTNHAEIVYACDSAAYAKLEAAFDASMRATKGIAPLSAAAQPAPQP